MFSPFPFFHCFSGAPQELQNLLPLSFFLPHSEQKTLSAEGLAFMASESFCLPWLKRPESDAPGIKAAIGAAAGAAICGLPSASCPLLNSSLNIEIIDEDYVGEYLLLDRNKSLNNIAAKF